MIEYYTCPVLPTCPTLRRDRKISKDASIQTTPASLISGNSSNEIQISTPIPTCVPGKYLDNGLCKTCEAGYYCKNSIRTPCNPEKSTSTTRYYSAPGFSKCYTDCPIGLYKNQIGVSPKLYTCEKCPFKQQPVLDANKSYVTGKNSNFCIYCNKEGKTITDVNTIDNQNKYTYNTCE